MCIIITLSPLVCSFDVKVDNLIPSLDHYYLHIQFIHPNLLAFFAMPTCTYETGKYINSKCHYCWEDLSLFSSFQKSPAFFVGGKERGQGLDGQMFGEELQVGYRQW